MTKSPLDRILDRNRTRKTRDLVFVFMIAVAAFVGVASLGTAASASVHPPVALTR